jgi:hypothetical protein
MRLALLVCILVSAGLLSGPADARSRERDKDKQAQTQEQKKERREERRETRDRSAEAARRAQQLNGGGRVLSVEAVGAGHRVKVLKDGEVRVLHVEDR